MFELTEIPKNPSDALKAIIAKLLATNGGNATVGDLKSKGHPLYSDLVIGTTAAIRTAARMSDPQVVETIITNLALRDEDSITVVKERFRTALELVVALDFDNHFIDEADVALFDEAELSQEDKKEIRELMAIARSLVDRSESLKEFQRRNILHHIAKIENELHREKSHFQTFMAATYQISGLVKQVGEDAKPIADAIEKARTITEKRVQGQLQIEQEQKPKQLENLKGN